MRGARDAGAAILKTYRQLSRYQRINQLSCCYSSTSEGTIEKQKWEFYNLREKPLVEIDLHGLRNCQVILNSTWSDCTAELQTSNADLFKNLHWTEKGGCLSGHVERDDSVLDNADSTLAISVPQHCDLALRTTGNITTRGKIEGRAVLHSTEGNIQIDKIKGEVMSLSANKGEVNISKGLEGNIEIKSVNLSAKQIRGPEIALECSQSINVGALYANGKLSVAMEGGDVNVRTLQCDCVDATIHGKGDMNMDFIEARQVSLETGDGNVRAHLGPMQPKGRYLIETRTGNVNLSIESPVTTHMALNGEIIEMQNGIDSADTFEGEKSDSAVAGILKVSDAFNAAPEQQKEEKSRNGILKRVSGKISQDGQQWARMKGSSSLNTEDLPSVKCAADGGSVTVRILSWIEMMSMKTGVPIR